MRNNNKFNILIKVLYLDDLAAAQVEAELVAPVPGRVELGPVLQGSHVVHLHLVPLHGLVICVKK